MNRIRIPKQIAFDTSAHCQKDETVKVEVLVKLQACVCASVCLCNEMGTQPIDITPRQMPFNIQVPISSERTAVSKFMFACMCSGIWCGLQRKMSFCQK